MSEDHPAYEAPNMTATEVQMRQILMPIHHQIERLEASISNAVAPRPAPHDKLFAALALAQGEIQSAIADKENTHFNFKYADLDACWEACRLPLSKNELAIIQLPQVGENNAVTMVTILGHSSGQSISSTYTMFPDKTTPQGIASCMTYLRRYMLCAMVGISQEDDDANRATADPDEYKRISKTQVDELLVLADNLFKKSADAVVERMLAKVFELTALKDIPEDLFEQAKTLLENQAKREGAAAKPKTDKEKLAEATKAKGKGKGKETPAAGPDVGDGPDNEVPGT